MQDRNSELDAFKQVNLTVIAAAYGYEVNRKKSTRASVVMSSGSDKILVSKQGSHYVYCSVFDPKSQGTAIDFAQRVIEPGCSMGRVRQLLRPFLSAGYVADVQSRFAGSVAQRIEPSQVDLDAVAKRFGQFLPVAGHHKFLCDIRGVPGQLLKSKRLEGRVYQCPRRGTVIFPHYGSPDGVTGERSLTGFEIKGRGVNLFSKGGQKGIWMSAPSAEDRVLAIAESGLDAVSYLAVRGEEGTRVASISGQMNSYQPELLRQVIGSLPREAHVVAAFDNDRAGDNLTARLRDIVSSIARTDVGFLDDRPSQRGQDWNQVLLTISRETAHRPASRPSLSR